MTIVLNGSPRRLEVESPARLGAVLEALELRADRVAVELNGEIAPRKLWGETEVSEGDRLEVVHFVGGGCRGAVAGVQETSTSLLGSLCSAMREWEP